MTGDNHFFFGKLVSVGNIIDLIGP
jgi:hypothetical protein